MASPAEVVRACLIEAGVVILPRDRNSVPLVEIPGTTDTPCFVESVPDQPDRLVAIKDTPGMSLGKTHQGTVTRMPGVSLLIRAADHEAYDFALAVFKALNSSVPGRVTVGGTVRYVQSIAAVGDLIRLGEETARRRQSWEVRARVSFMDIDSGG